MRHRFAARTAMLGISWGLLGMVTLGACVSGGDPTNSATRSPSQPATSSTSSTSGLTSSSSTSAAYVPVKPEFPAAAKKQTLKSAEAFVKYYFELLNYAYARPEAGLLTPYARSNCQTCVKYEARAQELVADSERFEGRIVEFKHVSYSTEDVANPWVTYNGRQLATRILDSRGRAIGSSGQKELFLRVVLDWTSEGWRIEGITSV